MPRRNDDSKIDDPKYLWYKSPVRFSSLTTVNQYIKENTRHDDQLRKRSLNNFKLFSEKILLGTRSNQRINRKQQFHYVLGSKNYLFQMDIADLFGDNRDRISEFNNSYKYILVIMNALTKKVYAYPLLNRENKTIINVLSSAFEKDLKFKKCEKDDSFAVNFHVDQEFTVGTALQKFMKSYCINTYYSQSDHKAGMVERYIRVLKERIVTRMEALRTEKWVKLLQDVVLQYNTLRKHSTTKLTPEVAEKYPNAAFIRILEKFTKIDNKTPLKKSFKFKIGDRVRISQRSKNKFRKDYQRRFTANTYIIYQKRKVKNMYVYNLKTRSGEALKGVFREDLLRKANIDNETYAYSVISKRDGQSLIHWDGFSSSEDEWIADNELTKKRV